MVLGMATVLGMAVGMDKVMRTEKAMMLGMAVEETRP